MADFLQHLWQAKHNEQSAAYILQTRAEFRDWAITCAFYSVLYYAEACFTTRSSIVAPKNTRDLHLFRSETIRREAPLAHYRYTRIQIACWNVRYLAKGPWQNMYNLDNSLHYVNFELPRCREELERAFGVNLI